MLGGFGRISSIFFVKVSSDAAVDSRPALLFFLGRAVWRSVHSRCFDCVDCLSLWHSESGHYFHELLLADRHLAAVSGLHEKS